MRYTVIFFLLVTLWGINSYSSVIEIDQECLYLSDIFRELPKKEIECGFNYGDEKKIFTQRLARLIPKERLSQISSEKKDYFVVKRKGELLEKEMLEERIKNELKNIYPDFRIEVERINLGGKIFVKNKNSYNIILPADTFGTVYPEIDNGFKTYKTYAFVKAFAKVSIAGEKISKGEDLEGKVFLREMDITNQKDVFLGDIIGMSAVQAIPKNRIVLKNMVHSKPDALKGEKVVIRYRSKTVSIDAEGILAEDAYVGKNVQVKNVSSEKIISGLYKKGKIVIIEGD